MVAGWAFDAFDFSILSFALNQMMAEFGVSKTVIGSVFGLQLVATGLGGVLFGVIADAIGRKRGLMLDIALYSVATGLTALSRNLWEVALFRFIAGLGIGGEWGLGMAILNEVWPPETRGSMVGLTQAGWPIGMAIASADAALVMSRFGWRAGFAVAILPIVLLVVVRGKMPESRLWLEYKRAKESGELPPELSEKAGWLTLRQLFHRDLIGRTLKGLALASLGMFAFYTLWSWAPAYLETVKGMSMVRSATFVGASWLIGWFGHVLFGVIADRIGRRPTFTIYAAMFAASVLGLTAAGPGLTGFVALAANTFACGFFSVYGALFGELFPTRVRATGASLCYNGARGVSFAAPVVLGYVAGVAGFNAGLLVAVVAVLLAAALIWTVPETKGVRLEAIG